MRRTGLWAFVPFVFLCSGCVVVSLHPLWSRDVIVCDATLEGTWIDLDPRWEEGPCVWTFSLDRRGGYLVRVAQAKETITFVAYVVKLGDSLYLDFRVEPKNEAPWTVQSHFFARLTVKKERLVVEPCDREKLESIIERHGATLTSEAVDNGDRLILTANTAELQAFFKEHGDEVVGEPLILHRKKNAEGG